MFIIYSIMDMAGFTNILDGSLLVAFYLLYQLPLLLASGLLARRFRPRNWFEFLTVAGFLYALFMTALPAALGAAGVLTAGSGLVSAWVAGAAVWVVEREQPPLQLPPLKLTLPELALLTLLCGFLGYQWRAFSYLPPLGTDAMIYHLYYPAVWIATGTVERLTQPGLVTSSYPCYGELVYAWQMLSAGSDFFAKNYQFFFLLLGVFATISVALAVGFRRISAIGAGLFVAFTGVVFRNASVSNTDIVTGTFLLHGLFFLATGARRNQGGWFLLAGAGFGMAVGTKFLGLLLAPPALLLAAAAVWLLRPACRKKLLECMAAAALTGSPCFFVNWLVAGNPFFPARIGFGNWVLFPNYLDLHAPAIGWSFDAWRFFVNADSHSLHLPNTLLLLLFLAAALTEGLFTVRGRRPFRRQAAAVLGMLIVALLAIQLKFYPAITQPRQIIPLAMLGASCCVVPLERLRKFRFFRSHFAMAPLIAVLLFLASFRQFHYQEQGGGMLICYAGGGAFLFAFLRSRKRGMRIGIAAAALALFLLDAGYCSGVSRSVASVCRRMFVSAANEDCRQLLERAAAGQRAWRIAYCGAFYYNFIGEKGDNTLLSIPVTASGKPESWDYHSFEEMRTPGSYAAWRERLHAARIDFLLVDLRTFPAPNPRIELDWANEHPEDFSHRFDAEGLTLFEVRKNP